MAIYKPQYKDDNGQIQDLNLPYINIYNDTYNIDPTIHWQFVDTTKYTPIEYVIFSGTNYINNNGILTEKTEYSLKLNFKTLGSGAFGLIGSYDSTQYLVKNTSVANIQWYYGSENQTGSPGFSTDTIYTISVRDKKLYVNDTVVITMTNSPTFSVTPYYIGNRYSVGSVTNGLNGNLYEFTIIDDKVTHIYKPVYEISTNYVGFVDTLTGDFYPLKIYGSSSSVTYTSGTTGGPEVTSNLDYVSNINNLIDSKVAIGGKDTWKDVTARGNISNGPIQIGGPLNLDSNSNTYIAFGTTSNPMAKNAFITSYNNGFIMGANTKSLYFLMEDALRPTTNDNGKSLNLGNTTRGWNNLYLSKNGKTGSSAGGTIVFSDNNTSNTKTTTLKDSATVARTLTLPDKTGTLAITDDIGNATINFSINGNTLSDSFTTNDATNKTINIGSNFVTTDTNQTITGHKTFTQRPGLQVTRLPSTYQEVTYLESNETPYIDTGLPVHMGWKYKITFQQNDNRTYRNWGVFNQQSYNGGLNCSLTYATNNWMVRWETVSGQTRAINLPTIDTRKHTLYIDNGEVYFDGIDYGKSAAHDSTVVSSYNAYLFTINPGGTTPTTNLNGKIYSYQVWDENGDEIQNLVPCYRKSDGVIGMYDTVNDEFLVNRNSSGEFTFGDDVLDSEFLVLSDLSDIASATKTKITYDTKGLVVRGEDLVASDIPNLDASKITSGTLSDSRISSASTWNSKVSGSNLTSDKIVVGNGTNDIKVSDKSIQDIINIAEGKTKTYVINASSSVNPTFNSQDDYITFDNPDASITLFNGSTITLSDINSGDIILITSEDLPDRWYAGWSSAAELGLFYTLETQSIDLSNYVTIDTDQEITGHKVFTQRPGLNSTRLPSDYQEVEYIKLAATSNTGNYIDTNVVITQADSLNIELDGAWNGDNSSFATFFGFMAASTTPRCAVSIYQNKYMIGIDSTYYSGPTTPNTDRILYKFYTVNGAQYLKLNDVVELSTSYSSSALNNNVLSLYLGARNTGGTANNFSGITIYSFHITTGTTSYNYVPCYRKSDNKLGLYELQNGVFYPVVGTGTPTKGRNVEDSEFLVFTDLATVATSGNYADLTNKPTIPTVSDAVITISQTGSGNQTFTLNQGSAKTITLTDNNTTYTLGQAQDASQNTLANTVMLTPSTGTAQTITINDVAHAVAADSATNADTLDGQHGSYYLDWDNFTDIPSTIVYTNTNQEITGEKTFALPIITTDSSNIGLVVKEDNTHQTQYKKSGITIRTISGQTPTDVNLVYPSVGGTLAVTDDINDGTLTLQVNGSTKTTFSANQTSSTTFNVTAEDLGLSQAMSFVGVSTTDPSSTTGATVSGHSTWTKGEIVIYKRSDETYYEEYINITGSNTSQTTQNPNWELLGDADSYALKSVSITGDGALGGGGTLAADRTITHNAGSAANKTSGWYKFSTDAYSHISGTTAVASSDIAGFLANTGNVTFTDNNSKISASVTFPVSDVQTKTTTSGSYASVVTSNVAKIDLSGYATTSSLSDYVTLAGTQTISGKKTFSHTDGVITTSKFVVQDESIVTSFDEDKIVRTDVQGGGTLVQTLNYPTFSSTSQNLTIATEDKIKNGLLTINVNDDESEFYANSASDVYVTITLPRVKRYI